MPNPMTLTSLLRKAAEQVPIIANETRIKVEPSVDADVYVIDLDNAQSYTVVNKYPLDYFIGDEYIGAVIQADRYDNFKVGGMVAYRTRPDQPYRPVEYFFTHHNGKVCIKYEGPGYDYIKDLVPYGR